LIDCCYDVLTFFIALLLALQIANPPTVSDKSFSSADYTVTVRDAKFTAINGVFSGVESAGIVYYTRSGLYRGVMTDFHIRKWVDETTSGACEWSISRVIASDNEYFDHYTTVGSRKQSVPPNGAVWKCTHLTKCNCTRPTVVVSLTTNRSLTPQQLLQLKPTTSTPAPILVTKQVVGNGKVEPVVQKNVANAKQTGKEIKVATEVKKTVASPAPVAAGEAVAAPKGEPFSYKNALATVARPAMQTQRIGTI
jgi:hypothetical protein